MKLIPALIAIAAPALAANAFAQSPSTTAAQVFAGKDVSAQLDSLVAVSKAKGASGATLGDYGSHAIKLSIRNTSGGAEIHAHFDDIFYVTGGTATLITGGTIPNSKTGANGETSGKAIEGGTKQELHKGDIVNIPAGTPHQLIIPPGETYESIVIKVKE